MAVNANISWLYNKLAYALQTVDIDNLVFGWRYISRYLNCPMLSQLKTAVHQQQANLLMAVSITHAHYSYSFPCFLLVSGV